MANGSSGWPEKVPKTDLRVSEYVRDSLCKRLRKPDNLRKIIAAWPLKQKVRIVLEGVRGKKRCKAYFEGTNLSNAILFLNQ